MQDQVSDGSKKTTPKTIVFLIAILIAVAAIVVFVKFLMPNPSLSPQAVLPEKAPISESQNIIKDTDPRAIELQNKTVNELLKSAKRYEVSQYGKLKNLYDSDVFKYYSLESKYDSELKKVTFQESAEYRDLSSSLNEIRQKENSTIRYMVLKERLKKYDVNSGRFPVFLGSNYGIGTREARAPKSVDGILFPTIPSTLQLIRIEGLPNTSMQEELFSIPMDRANALIAENNRETVSIYFFFYLKGVTGSKFRFWSLSNPPAEYELTQPLLKSSDYIKIAVIQDSTGKILFEGICDPTGAISATATNRTASVSAKPADADHKGATHNQQSSGSESSSAKSSISPSFDCAKSSNNAERLICSTDSLAKADLQMVQAYKVALANTPDKNAMKREQINWLKNRRNTCIDEKTMLEAYQERIQQLSR